MQLYATSMTQHTASAFNQRSLRPRRSQSSRRPYARPYAYFSLLVASSLLCFRPAIAADLATPMCDAPSTQAITDSHTKQVLQALVNPASAQNRAALLEQYLATPMQEPNSAQKVATSHARLVLAAERVHKQDYVGARQSLSQIDLSSTVAVDAALLLAESWRLQGDSAQSHAWLMRVAQRYSSDPRALEGLLLSARDQASNGNAREAWALYSVINEKVLKNVEQVSVMRSQSNDFVNELLETRLDESREVTSQVVKNILQDKAHSALSNMRALLEAKRQLACLEMQGNAIKDDAWDESIQAAHVTSFKTMLETEARINERQLETFNKQLATVSAEERPAIKAQMTELQEHMRSLAQRLNELNRQHMALPAESLSKKKQLEQRIASTKATVEQNRAEISQELDNALASLQTRYRELAAETQLARAELMQLLASN